MTVKDKIKIPKKDLKNIVMYGKRVLWGLVAFLLCFSSVVGGCCPFAVALIAVSGRKNFLFACFLNHFVPFCAIILPINHRSPR